MYISTRIFQRFIFSLSLSFLPSSPLFFLLPLSLVDFFPSFIFLKKLFIPPHITFVREKKKNPGKFKIHF